MSADDGTHADVVSQTGGGAGANSRFEFKVTKQELVRQKIEALAARQRQQRDERERERPSDLTLMKEHRPLSRMGGDNRDYRDHPHSLGVARGEGGGEAMDSAPNDGNGEGDDEVNGRDGDVIGGGGRGGGGVGGEAEPLIIGRGESIGTIPRAFRVGGGVGIGIGGGGDDSTTPSSRGAMFEAFAMARAQAMRDRARGKGASADDAFTSRPGILIDSGDGRVRPAMDRGGGGGQSSGGDPKP
jgi:hypothetical protein